MSSPPRTSGGSACDGSEFCDAHPSFCLSRSVGTKRVPCGILELALQAISLRHSSARSVVTGSQRLGRYLTLILSVWHPGCFFGAASSPFERWSVNAVQAKTTPSEWWNPRAIRSDA